MDLREGAGKGCGEVSFKAGTLAAVPFQTMSRASKAEEACTTEDQKPQDLGMPAFMGINLALFTGPAFLVLDCFK